FADGRPRIVNIKGIRMDAEFGPSMVYITNLDKPGFIGKFSSTMGAAGINIATFHVGREAPGANAIALIEIDGDMPLDVLAKVRALPRLHSPRLLRFGCCCGWCGGSEVRHTWRLGWERTSEPKPH